VETTATPSKASNEIGGPPKPAAAPSVDAAPGKEPPPKLLDNLQALGALAALLKGGAAPEADGGSRKLLATLKEIAGLSAVLYVCGFLVVRTRLSTLGVTAGLPVADEQYLVEGAAFAVSTVEMLLFPWGFLLLFVAGIVAVALGDARAKLSVVARAPKRAILAIHVAIAVVLTKLVESRFNKSASVLHLLAPDAGPTRRVDPVLLEQLRGGGSGSEDVYLFLLAVVAATAASLWLFWGNSSIPAAPRALRYYLVGLLSVELVLLPMNFAVLVWDPSFPVVSVTAKVPVAELSGPVHLLLQNDKEIVVHGGGRIVSIARDEITMIRTHCHANVLKTESCPSTETADETGKHVTSDALDAGAVDVLLRDDADIDANDGRGAR
jgi:hypothetical protein